MKKLLYKTLAVFYRYYDKGATETIAYESAILGVVLIAFLNMYAIAHLAGVQGVINEVIFVNSSRWITYLKVIGIIVALLFILKLIFPKKELLNFNETYDQRKWHGPVLVFYIIGSVLFLIWAVSSTH
jgi:hypothetical protein